MVLGPNADARPEERMHAEVYRADRHYSGTCLRASGGLLQYRSCCSSVHASSSHCRHCPGCSGTRTPESSAQRSRGARATDCCGSTRGKPRKLSGHSARRPSPHAGKAADSVLAVSLVRTAGYSRERRVLHVLLTSERSSVRLSNRKCWLNVLHRVGIPVASAILALAKPDKYAVIDFRGWRQIFARKKNSFSTRDYLTYLHPGERTVRQ